MTITKEQSTESFNIYYMFGKCFNADNDKEIKSLKLSKLDTHDLDLYDFLTNPDEDITLDVDIEVSIDYDPGDYYTPPCRSVEWFITKAAIVGKSRSITIMDFIFPKLADDLAKEIEKTK